MRPVGSYCTDITYILTDKGVAKTSWTTLKMGALDSCVTPVHAAIP
jgi:hypothetical protein